MPANKTATANFTTRTTSHGGVYCTETSAPHCTMGDSAEDALGEFEALQGEMETCTA